MTSTVPMDLQEIDVLVGKISDSTGLSKKAISDQLNQANIRTFSFDDMILVSPNDLDVIIDAWADSIKAQLSNGSAAPAKKSTPKAAPAKRTAKAKPTAKKKSTAKASAKASKKASPCSIFSLV